MANLMNLEDAPVTKLVIAATAQDYADRILELGEMSPLRAYIGVRSIYEVADLVMKALKSYALEDAEANKGDTFRGVSWKVSAGRTTYDYSHDATWASLTAQIKELEAKRKAREEFLRALPDDMVDPATGEFVSPAKIKSIGDTVLALTFPKE